MRTKRLRRISLPTKVRGFSCLFTSVLVLFAAPYVSGQASQFLPEVDAYLDLNSDVNLWFQAKSTREGRTPVQAQIGPSINFYVKSLPRLVDLAMRDWDNSESRLLILSMGHRYLAQAGGAAGTNRLEPIATLQEVIKGGFQVSDRNRFDLDWQNGGYNWRYRNRFQFARGFDAGHHRITPYASTEVYYQSKYQKWSETDLCAGFRFAFSRMVALNPYYEHENNTGKSPNRQVNTAGLVLNLYFSRH